MRNVFHVTRRRDSAAALNALVLLSALVCLSVFVYPTGAAADEPVDLDMVTKIRDEGFNRSKVMETTAYLSDRIGPRLTGSPQMKQANEWTLQTMEEWGLENGSLDAFEFGRGWSFSRAAVHMTAPHQAPLLALPKAWTPGTKKAVRGKALRMEVESAEDLEEFRGEVKGKVLFLSEPREIEQPEEGDHQRRHDEESLEEATEYPIRAGRGGPRPWRRRAVERRKLAKALNEFLEQEKALATVEISSRDHGILRLGGGGSRKKGESVGVTALSMAAEHYNHVLRLLDDDVEVELEIEVEARFHDDEGGNAYNTVAEIPGTDKADELVMAGGHLDSWHPGTGATDNGASCAVIMEAVRILKAVGVEPRRTIRVALWSGEEQGLIGSRAYVDEHFASRPDSGDDESRFSPRGPLTYLPGHAKLSAYFNMDNGGGRLRGVYAEGSAAAAPIFEAWLRPLHDLGATTVTLRPTFGTDHQSFDGVGLPGFQFIQDGLDYRTLTHHTNLDTLDYVYEEDLKQASVVLATFLYHAAMREEMMPRKPLPKDPEEEEGEDEGDGPHREGRGEGRGGRGGGRPSEG